MEQVTLQEYCQEIEGMIERSGYDEAAAHCRHILQQYPKYVEAYRLLGKAALDREDDKQATDLFARVLSADPADFVSRAGLSIIYDRQGSVRDAVWHMERAYELAPGNPVVQDELRKLYARRDGVEPARVPLTRGALARLYVNGELYTEAVAELYALLAQEPDRVDLQALLAEALWRSDQRVDAADTALRVLDRLPYCLDANLILGEIWTSGGREEDADVHLKRAQALDPLATRASTLFGKSSPIAPQYLTIPRLEYTPPLAAPTAEDQIPEWLAGVGAQMETGPGGEEVPAWLQGIGLPSAQPEMPVAAEPAPGLRATEPAQVTPPVEEEIPDWLAGMATTPAQAEAPEPAAEGEGVPEWLQELRATVTTEAGQPPAEEAVPDWLKQLGGPAKPEAEQPVAQEAAPDWLVRLREQVSSVPGEPVEAAPQAPAVAPDMTETPEWLRALHAEPSAPPVEGAPLQVAPQGAPEPAEFPDWLQALGTESAQQPALPPTEEAATGLPDWLSQMRPGVVPEAAPPPPAVAPEPAEIPDWLQALKPEGAERPVPPMEQALGAPDWLSELGAGAAAIPAGEAEEGLAAPEPGEVPDWLKALGPAGTGPAPVTPAAPEPESPAWLTGEGPMPSPEEAMAYFEKLTAGKEAELQAQAQADAEARMADIMGRKPTPAPAPVPPAPPAPVVPPPQAPPPPLAAEAPAWLTEGGAMPSPEEAMAYFQKLTAGKEAELQAQAQANAEVRMADIMGRKPTPAHAPEPVQPAPPAPVTPPLQAPPPPRVVEAPARMVGEGAVPSPEEALEYLHRITAGKEAELQAQAEAEARLADISGRKPVPAPEPAPAEWEKAGPAEAALPEAEAPDWLAVLMQPEAAPAPPVEAPPLAPMPVLPAQLAPEAEARVLAEPQAIGPEWWYQTREDEEGPIEELAVEQPLVEVEPIKVTPVAPVVSFVPPPPPAPGPRLAAPAPKKLVRAKPATPPPTTVDMEALLARLHANPADYDALLGMARGWMQTADLNAARGAYDELVRAGALLDQVLPDLGQVAEDRPDDVEFIRLLGDAHMKAGNLQKALKLYRQALRKL